ncbi:OmpP1/FadL family transporter [Herbaspirillum rubrisubalbicans]|uniref:OmpP1/FadL family transporter n=1 Tax=Herbaspirillum rubrisubalbicans TaxID=80842 RepID=UPI000DD36B48|nr:outer membrane protein transport protein [Herbaspirillum rubrisubalbicans]
MQLNIRQFRPFPPFPQLPLFSLLMLFGGIAHATDGYFQHGYGVRSQGAGGVGIALPQDGLAAASNPAGTAFVGDRLDVGLTWFSPTRGAEVTGNQGPVNGSFDGSGKKNFFLPEIGWVKQINPQLAAGIAVYGNGGMNTTYRSGVPLFGSGEAGVNLEQLFIAPNVAWKVNESHAFGLAVNFAYQRFEAKGLSNFDNALFSSSPGNVTDRGTDTSTGWGLHLGYIGKITPDLTVGLTWSSKIKASKFDKYQGLFSDGGSFDIPENYGIGLAYKLTPALTLAADVNKIVYSGVSSVAAPIANFASARLGSSTGPGFGWQDVTVYKIGTVYEVTPNLTLRAGYNHASQPIPSSQTLFNILAPGVVQDHVSVGGTYKLAGGGEVSLAYTHAFKKTINGAASIPPSFGGGNANVHLEEDILGVAYTWKF